MFPEIVCKCFYSPTIVSYAYLMTAILTTGRWNFNIVLFWFLLILVTSLFCRFHLLVFSFQFFV